MTSLRIVPKEAREAVKQAIKEGWLVVRPRGGHIKMSKAGCRTVFLSASPSDRRAILNFIGDLKREGLWVKREN
jgi:predicted RNA binding protein YcfA (HicA-like mRNA interferase family)